MTKISEKYLVTGGAGFIGSHLVRRLVAEGKTVRVVDNLSTGQVSRLADLMTAIEFVEGDLADERVSQDAVKEIDYVLHQAAVPSVQRSVQDPVSTNRANITATLNLLESCRRAGVRRLVYAASSSAYGDTEILPKHEDMPAKPLSPYALQKFVGEQYCKLYHELYGLETVSLRYFNVFGPGQDPHSEYSAVIPKFITGLLANQPITIFGDGEQSRDFTYIDNVVEANLLALQCAGGRRQDVQYRLRRAHKPQSTDRDVGKNYRRKGARAARRRQNAATCAIRWPASDAPKRSCTTNQKSRSKKGCGELLLLIRAESRHTDRRPEEEYNLGGKSMRKIILGVVALLVLGGGVLAYSRLGGSPEVKRERALKKAARLYGASESQRSDH